MAIERCVRCGPDCWAPWLINRRLRQRWCKKHFGWWGKGAELRLGAYIVHPKNIFVGENVVIRPGCQLYADECCSISIYDNVLLGPGVSIFVNNHGLNPEEREDYSRASVVIEEDVWIGANSIILSGVKIGYGATIGGGSVVTKNVPPLEVWCGNPARKVKDAPR